MQLFKTKNNLPSSRELFFLCGNFLFLELFTFTEKCSNDHTWQNNLKLLSIYLSHCLNPLFVYVFNQLFWIFCWCLFPVTRLHTNPPKVTPPATREPSVCWSQTKQTASVAQFTHTSVVTQSSQASLSVRVEVKLLITSCYEHMRKNKLN